MTKHQTPNTGAATITSPAPSSLDTVTVLLTEPGKLATKQFSRTSPKSSITVNPYDAGYRADSPLPIPTRFRSCQRGQMH